MIVTASTTRDYKCEGGWRRNRRYWKGGHGSSGAGLMCGQVGVVCASLRLDVRHAVIGAAWTAW
eukprot:5151822-Pyramimonas_sp.AAC.1